jgi:putative component of membrane protein insertase Oxa1/YidC/SpoIIIJ protein YidD
MLADIGKFLIKFYWRKIPPSERKVCIHKISCSNAVYESLDKYGFLRGVKIYWQRRKSCNSNYIISKVDNAVVITTSSGDILQEMDINPIIVKEFNTSP